MKNTCKGYLKFIFLAVLSLPAASVSGQEAVQPEAQQEPFSLYFDESQLVEVTTRTPKPITQVAENVSIITAEDIERMHAHTVNEVLNRVGGVFVAWFGQDFGGSSAVSILGSREYHTLALLDGVRINNASGGTPFFNFIPIGIVKRIEIIKGPASSVWGSALGGVVNIVTKNTGNTKVPKGSLTATYGEAASREFAGEAFGAIGLFSYYLNADSMDSDGLKFDRFFDRETAYGKFRFALPHKAFLSFAGGYSDPYFRGLNWHGTWGQPGLDSYETQRIRHFWGTAYLDLPIAERWDLHLALQRYNQNFSDNYRSLGTGVFGGSVGTDLDSSEWDEHTTTVEGRLSWRGESVRVNIGAETSRSRLDFRDSFPGISSLGWDPFETIIDPAGKEERRGIYANATWTIGDVSLSPGLRYDYVSTSKEFVSPSFGATWRVRQDTLLRATVARGFSAPYLAVFVDNNADLKPEKILSYQAGVETTRLPWMYLKANVFHQQVEDVWNQSAVPWQNTGRTRWNGADVELKSREFKGFSVTANFSYILEDSVIDKGNGPIDLDNEELYGGNLILDYANRSLGIAAQLAGHYVHWNEFFVVDFPKDDSWLWDASLTKTFAVSRYLTELFVAVHNITNASQYWDFEYENPDRWVEAGLKFSF